MESSLCKLYKYYEYVDIWKYWIELKKPGVYLTSQNKMQPKFLEALVWTHFMRESGNKHIRADFDICGYNHHNWGLRGAWVGGILFWEDLVNIAID